MWKHVNRALLLSTIAFILMMGTMVTSCQYAPGRLVVEWNDGGAANPGVEAQPAAVVPKAAENISEEPNPVPLPAPCDDGT